MEIVQLCLFDGKACPKCGIYKLLSEYHRSRMRSDGLAHICKGCACQKSREWGEKNKELKRTKQREYYRLKHPDQRPSAEERLQRLREHRNAYMKRWRIVNRGTEKYKALNRAKSRRYWNRKRALVGDYSHAEWQALCAKYNFRCACCGEQKPLTVDHVVPLSKGGANLIENLQPLCQSCNSRKRDRVIDYRISSDALP